MLSEMSAAPASRPWTLTADDLLYAQAWARQIGRGHWWVRVVSSPDQQGSDELHVIDPRQGNTMCAIRARDGVFRAAHRNRDGVSTHASLRAALRAYRRPTANDQAAMDAAMNIGGRPMAVAC